MMRHPSRTNATRELEAQAKWSDLSKALERFLFQKSRITWLQHGDCNSTYFHRIAETRRTANTIMFLEDEEGTKHETKEDMLKHCHDYYSIILGQESEAPRVEQSDLDLLLSSKCSSESKVWLTRDVTEDEIREEVRKLPSNKSPGPDGFTGEFFKSSWHIIGPEVTEAIKEFFSSRSLLRQLNATTLVLIPKVQNASKLNDFRPISCLNTIYKVIARILASRLQKVLPEIISPTQTAFLSGRMIAENVLLATEIVQGYNLKNISRRGMLKVDIRKAFDSVDWKFIAMALRAIHVPDTFLEWITECISTPSFAVSLNGAEGLTFNSGKGLRQGDPLSPYLFVVVMDVFSRLVSSRYRQGEIGYHPRTCELAISHLMFADDVMLFFDGSAHSLHGISEMLSDFASWSGLTANRNKTCLYIAGVEESEFSSLSSYGYPCGNLPIRYLGLPLMSRKLKISEYEVLLTRVEDRMKTWAAKALSFAGRLQLIKSVITGMINYWFQVFTLPKGCVTKLEGLCARYLWAGNTEEKHKAKVCWNDVCLPKEEGGLGLRRLNEWNVTLSLKLFWFLHSRDDSLWVRWHMHHNVKGKSIWEVKCSQNSSWSWKALMNLRPLAAKYLRCSVGNGTRAAFWLDSWTPFGPLIHYLGEHGPARLRIPLESKVANACNHEGWLLPRVRLGRERDVQNYLAGIPTPSGSAGSDIFGWWVQNALANTFSASKTWEDLRRRGEEKHWFNFVWFNGAIPSHAFTMWITQLNRLPTRRRLHAWDSTIEENCVICQDPTETRDHLFLVCPYVVSFWMEIFSRITPGQVAFHSWDQLLSWTMTSSCSAPSRLRKVVTQATVYFTWSQRNLKLHENRILPAAVAFKELDKVIKRILTARRSRGKWKKLPLLWIS